jgi:hypothetical protein
MIITASAYESGKPSFRSVCSANSCVIIASIWVGLDWFKATSVALLTTLSTGVHETWLILLKKSRTFYHTHGVFCYPRHNADVISFAFRFYFYRELGYFCTFTPLVQSIAIKYVSGNTNKSTTLQPMCSSYQLAPALFGVMPLFRELTPK